MRKEFTVQSGMFIVGGAAASVNGRVCVSVCLCVCVRASYLPAQRVLVLDAGRQADAECDGVGGAGEDAGHDRPAHGEREHGVHHKHDEQEEGHLHTGTAQFFIFHDSESGKGSTHFLF